MASLIGPSLVGIIVPRRNCPMASLIGPSLVGIIYLAVSVVLLVLLFWLVHRKKGTLAAVLCTLLALVVLALGYGFGSWYAPVDKDIGSDVYTEAEMDAAVDAIMAESFWDEMHARVLDIHYIGDEQSCAVFNTDFRSAFLAKNAAPLAPREVYTDYQWVLARADGGSWEVVTSGYA